MDDSSDEGTAGTRTVQDDRHRQPRACHSDRRVGVWPKKRVELRSHCREGDRLPELPAARAVGDKAPWFLNDDVPSAFLRLFQPSFSQSFDTAELPPPPAALATPIVSANAAQHINRMRILICTPPSPQFSHGVTDRLTLHGVFAPRSAACATPAVSGF